MFVILPRDQAPGINESSQLQKIVRVVSTVQYLLDNGIRVTASPQPQESLPRIPAQFWVVVGVHFIDKIGGTLAFPFFALYITGKFDVGMTEAGILLGLLSLAGIVGSVDRRRR